MNKEIFEWDVCLKDEGEILTIIFQSEAAKKVIRAEKDAMKHVTGDEMLKLDVDMKSKKNIVSWLISHNLSWEEF
jgi:uncharacterized protein YbcI